MGKRFSIFFSALFITTALPYLNFLLPFIPGQLLGFNLTGWAWMIMLLITLILLYDTTNIVFPVYFWLPWILYLIISLITDFSFLGFQLSLQYILPILVGVVASGFNYSEYNISWIFKWFKRLCVAIYLLIVIGLFFRRGMTPSPSATPMFFSVMFSLLIAFYVFTKELKYLLFASLLFLVSVIGLRRMGIAATAAIFVFHFAEINLRKKTLYLLIAGFVLFLIFNSKSFQEDTFYGGHGEFSDLSVNYYENTKLKSSGRQSWRIALEPGLRKAPLWGNGPRADNIPLTKITGMRYGEAHNDYLAVRYNYGYFGLGLLLSGFLLTFISLYRVFRKCFSNDLLWLITSSTLSLFVGFLIFMYSDNILKYTIFFPNYFFVLIGIVYALRRDERNTELKSF